MEYTDQQITCADCAASFIFTAGEQDFYAKKGFAAPPKRCKACRAERKRTRENGGGGGGGSTNSGVYRSPGFDDGLGMNEYRAPSFGGNGASRGAFREVDGNVVRGARPPRLMYDIVCGQCG